MIEITSEKEIEQELDKLFRNARKISTKSSRLIVLIAAMRISQVMLENTLNKHLIYFKSKSLTNWENILANLDYYCLQDDPKEYTAYLPTTSDERMQLKTELERFYLGHDRINIRKSN